LKVRLLKKVIGGNAEGECGQPAWGGAEFSVLGCQWRRGKSGNRKQKLETGNQEEKRSEYGAGVKSIKTKRLAKGSPILAKPKL
jgi:hypothetical protein